MCSPIYKRKEHHGMLLKTNFYFVSIFRVFVLFTAVCSWTAAPIPKRMAKIACPFLTVRLIWTWRRLTFA